MVKTKNICLHEVAGGGLPNGDCFEADTDLVQNHTSDNECFYGNRYGGDCFNCVYEEVWIIRKIDA